MKLIATSKKDQNVAVIDPWTAVHLATGLAAGLMGFSYSNAMLAAIAFEAVENLTPMDIKIFKASKPESGLNIVADVAVFAVGWQLGTIWNATGRKR